VQRECLEIEGHFGLFSAHVPSRQPDPEQQAIFAASADHWTLSKASPSKDSLRAPESEALASAR
jgi:hypothetical protein